MLRLEARLKSAASPHVSEQEEALLVQLINSVRQRLLIGLHIPPDVAVALMPGGLARVMHTFGFGELPQKRMPQHVGGDILICFPNLSLHSAIYS